MQNSLQSRQVPLESDQTVSKSWLIFGQADADSEHWNEAPNAVVAILTKNLLNVFFLFLLSLRWNVRHIGITIEVYSCHIGRPINLQR